MGVSMHYLNIYRMKTFIYYLNSASFAHLISLYYEYLVDHRIKIYNLKHLKSISHAKKVSTQIINEKLIIIIYLKLYKNVKTEFS